MKTPSPLVLLPVVLFAIALSACSSAGNKVAQRPAVPFSRVFYAPTTGQVGYHFDSGLKVYEDDMPAPPNCALQLDNIVLGGALPPGLAMAGTRIQGTPRQPGNWVVPMQLQGLHCTAGTDLNYYGNRSITVHLSIEP